ncbi:MAG: vWA domain-containing protein [Dehalococcoidia bacterium]
MLRRLWRQEFGQGLVLAALVMIVILGFAAMAVDVGYWFSQKGEVQNAVDAAALAGARELPNNYQQAQAKAREYLLKNGVDTTKGDTITITFRCTSTYQVACDPTTNHWDTIVVSVQRQVQAWFARVFDIQHALVGDVHAAGCNGPCGGAAYQPADVVQILDRSSSMTSTDMTNVKNAAKALLEYFQPSLQHVGLAVLGPSSTTTICSSPNAGGLGIAAATGGEWLPVLLMSDYQNSNGTLNTNSLLVKTINCLNNSQVQTDLGEPMKAATDYLKLYGRSGMTWGIILLTDGAANALPAYDTGYLNCTQTAPVPGGHNDGFETTPLNACTDGSGQATDASSGTNKNDTCADTDTGKDRHMFYNYGISVPSGNNIMGIEVRLDAWASSNSSSPHMCVRLSWDGGNTWTASEQTSNFGTSQQTYILGSNGDTWGHTWTPSELSDANFRVKVTDVATNNSRTFNLDWAAVKVYYAPATTGPCAYTAQQADAAKAAGIEVFTIGYGVGSGDVCSDTTGAWKNKNAIQLLQNVATDSAHFFNQPTKGDLQAVFQVIGSQIASGARLVE